jgi:hypothetical protein
MDGKKKISHTCSSGDDQWWCHCVLVDTDTACLCLSLQAIPFLFLEEVRRKDWMESFAHHIVTLGLMYYR